LTQDLLADQARFTRAASLVPYPGEVRTSREGSELEEATLLRVRGGASSGHHQLWPACLNPAAIFGNFVFREVGNGIEE
jgi:hypothetical protein